MKNYRQPKPPYKPYLPNCPNNDQSSQVQNNLAEAQFPIQNPQSQQYSPEQALKKGTLFPDLFKPNYCRQAAVNGGEA